MADPHPWHQTHTLAGRPVEVRPAAIEAIIDLRYRTLIAGTGRHSARFPGDREADTVHFGAFTDGACVGCATLLRRAHVDEPGWQLRGMGVDDGWRGSGVGTALLAIAEAWAVAHGPTLIWCNARLDAEGFYAGHGWARVSAVFDVPGVGPHVEMSKRLSR